MADPVVNLTPSCGLKGKVVRIVLNKLAEQVLGGHVRDVYAFNGIPYAQPPVGHLRFCDPQPVTLWTGVRDAKEYGAVCPQDFTMFDAIEAKIPRPTLVSEDCLFLNISTPTLDPNARLPVIVWIHGGAFTTGFSQLVEAPNIVNFHDVVVVTINYRLAAFGFFCTGDSAAHGNYGMLDQIEALRFVKRHVAQFGGDPDNVTLNGESSGSMSITLLMSSPLARGLFKRAICESGTCLSPGAVKTPAAAAAAIQTILKTLPGCPETLTDGAQVVEFARGLSTEAMMRLGAAFCCPVEGGSLLPGGLQAIYKNPVETPCDLLIGCNSHEGLMMFKGIGSVIGLTESSLQTMDLRTAAFSLCSVLIGPELAASVADAVAEKYATVGGDGSSADRVYRAIVEFLGDYMFVADTVAFAKQNSLKNKTFLYEFSHRPSFLANPPWVQADHGAEAYYVIGMLVTEELCPENVSAEDLQMTKLLMNYWANFAKTGDPNSSDLHNWPVYEESHRRHIVLKLHPEVSSHLKQERVEYWISQRTKS